MDWKPPDNWLRIKAVDAHTAGEPLRIYIEGYPEPKGETILLKRRYALENMEYLRTATMWEPRGHADMYGCLITEPVTEDGDIGVLFLHNEGYSSMCGHGIIAITKVGLETGLFKDIEDNKIINIDTPAGRVTATANWKNNIVNEVSFNNVPSFLQEGNQQVNIPGLGIVTYDLAFGGAYYALVQAGELDVELNASGFRRLIELGTAIKQAIVTSRDIVHPFEKDLGFLYGVIFIGDAHDKNNHSRNVCVFADGEVDRSPTGTGVSARTAVHYSRGELALNQPFTVESILGTCFTGEAVEEIQYGPYQAVIPKITGSANICGLNTLLIDPEDPLKHGFILR